MSLAANRAALAAKLTGAGLERVVVDPRDVSPPCALVGMPRRLSRAACGLQGEVVVTLIGAGPSNADVADWLLEQLELVAAVVHVTGAEPTAYQPEPGAPGTLPAYEATTPITT